MKKTTIFMLILLVFCTLFAVEETGYSKDQLITLQKETPFVEAMRLIEQLSQQYEGRKIVNLCSYTDAIRMPIRQTYWKDALAYITEFNNIILTELPGAYQLSNPEKIESLGGEQLAPDTKQVRISAVFFKLNESFSNNVGIDWSTLIDGEVKASVNFKGAEAVADDLFGITGSTSLDAGDYTIDVNTLFRVIEAYQEGTVLARPNVIVLSGKTGNIQVGEDFSIKTIDDDGNTTDEFFSTGIILDVTPTILKQGDKEAIHLIASVENSSAIPGDISTIITKSTSQTELLLYDGEETVIGGLYDTDYQVIRRGIPLLKDLPWWVFGIRYLTGYNSKEKSSGEMIILLKAEILKPIIERRDKMLSIKEKISETREDNRQIENLFDQDLKSLEEAAKDK